MTIFVSSTGTRAFLPFCEGVRKEGEDEESVRGIRRRIIDRVPLHSTRRMAKVKI